MAPLRVLVDASGIATVTLDRPAKRNAVTLATWREIAQRFRAFADDPAVRVVVLTGAGGHFCAGADISEFDRVRATVEDGVVYEHAVDGCTEAIMALPKPTIAAISGYCVGGGCGLAMACDFRIADRTASFGIPAARLGIVYGPLDCRNLIALVGLARAKEILFSARRFDAIEAHRIGFVDRLADDLAADVADFAGALAENAPLSIAGNKLILHSVASGQLEARERDIDAALARALASADYKEAVRAFGEKRRPSFTGR
jgi:enoyl-CoA hydratase/carnithine racemase